MITVIHLYPSVKDFPRSYNKNQEHVPGRNDIITTPQILGQILTLHRMDVLHYVATHKVKDVVQLAKGLKRSRTQVGYELEYLVGLGFLKYDKRNRKIITGPILLIFKNKGVM